MSRPADPVEVLRRLITFDTTNPPGDEKACVDFAAAMLEAAGFETRRLARDPRRPNLLTRLSGAGSAPPLLVYGHLDVVPTAGQRWTHPPFAGVVEDGFVWGRGALDMKGGLAMCIAALVRARHDGVVPRGEIRLLLLADEEVKGEYGARFLVDEHPEIFDGVRWAIGEFGGFSLTFGGRRFYPVMVAEKQVCRVELSVRGRSGHGSMPVRGQAAARLGRLLTHLDSLALPIHVTPVADLFFEALAEGSRAPLSWIFSALRKPRCAAAVLRSLGERRTLFEPLLRNTVAVVGVRGGGDVNVLPSELVVQLDCRLLPGFGPDDLVAELRAALGGDRAPEIRVTRFDPGPSEVDLDLFGTLADGLRRQDPDGVPVPFLLTGTTDARHLCRLGIQTYGYLPMRLPADFEFSKTVHAADERVPVSALHFGTKVLRRLFEEYTGEV